MPPHDEMQPAIEKVRARFAHPLFDQLQHKNWHHATEHTHVLDSHTTQAAN